MNATTDLEALALEADAAGKPAPEGAPGAPGAPGAAQGPTPNHGAIAFALTMFVQLASIALGVESLRVTMSAANIETCASVLAPVADKYGLNLATAFEGPELVALMTAGPILWAAASQLNMELKAKRAKPVDQAAANDDQAKASG